MPGPKLVRNAALAALLAGLIALIANLYLDATGHPGLASLAFMLAMLCSAGFAVSSVVWAFVTQWQRETEHSPPPAPSRKPSPGKKPPPQAGGSARP